MQQSAVDTNVTHSTHFAQRPRLSMAENIMTVDGKLKSSGIVYNSAPVRAFCLLCNHLRKSLRQNGHICPTQGDV